MGNEEEPQPVAGHSKSAEVLLKRHIRNAINEIDTRVRISAPAAGIDRDDLVDWILGAPEFPDRMPDTFINALLRSAYNRGRADTALAVIPGLAGKAAPETGYAGHGTEGEPQSAATMARDEFADVVEAAREGIEELRRLRVALPKGI